MNIINEFLNLFDFSDAFGTFGRVTSQVEHTATGTQTHTTDSKRSTWRHVRTF